MSCNLFYLHSIPLSLSLSVPEKKPGKWHCMPSRSTDSVPFATLRVPRRGSSSTISTVSFEFIFNLPSVVNFYVPFHLHFYLFYMVQSCEVVRRGHGLFSGGQHRCLPLHPVSVRLRRSARFNLSAIRERERERERVERK